MAQKKIRLNESQLKKVITESVERVLNEISSDMLKRTRSKFSDKYGSWVNKGEMTDKLEKDKWGNLLHPKDKKPLANHYQKFADAIHNAEYDEERNDPVVKKAAQLWDMNCNDAEWDDDYECGVLEVDGWTFWGDADSPDAQIEFEGPNGESGSFRAGKINRKW